MSYEIPFFSPVIIHASTNRDQYFDDRTKTFSVLGSNKLIFRSTTDQGRIELINKEEDVVEFEISTADNGNEPITVAQYKVNDVTDFSQYATTVHRKAYLLNENGDTIFPGSLTCANGHIKLYTENNDIYISSLPGDDNNESNYIHLASKGLWIHSNSIEIRGDKKLENGQTYIDIQASSYDAPNIEDYDFRLGVVPFEDANTPNRDAYTYLYAARYNKSDNTTEAMPLYLDGSPDHSPFSIVRLNNSGYPGNIQLNGNTGILANINERLLDAEDRLERLGFSGGSVIYVINKNNERQNIGYAAKIGGIVYAYINPGQHISTSSDEINNYTDLELFQYGTILHCDLFNQYTTGIGKTWEFYPMGSAVSSKIGINKNITFKNGATGRVVISQSSINTYIYNTYLEFWYVFNENYNLYPCTVTIIEKGQTQHTETLVPGQTYFVSFASQVNEDEYFLYWQGSDGKIYHPGDIITIYDNLTLTSVLTAKVLYTITYIQDNIQTSDTAQQGTEYYIKGPDKYNDIENQTVFTSWLGSDGHLYQPGDIITVRGDLSLEKQTRPSVVYQVSYTEKNGESFTTTAIENETYTINKPSNYVIDSQEFVNWIDQNGVVYNPNDKVIFTNNIVLTAQYQEAQNGRVSKSIFDPINYSYIYTIYFKNPENIASIIINDYSYTETFAINGTFLEWTVDMVDLPKNEEGFTIAPVAGELVQYTQEITKVVIWFDNLSQTTADGNIHSISTVGWDPQPVEIIDVKVFPISSSSVTSFNFLGYQWENNTITVSYKGSSTNLNDIKLQATITYKA